MKNNYILIDYENVQPVNLEILNGHKFKLIVFVGANQKNVAFDFVAAMQNLGDSASYQKISGNGSNALDFHIAFYLGELAASDENAVFHVISRDKGFDPLLTHLRSRKIFARRRDDVSEISFIKVSTCKTFDEKIQAIVASLASRGPSRPRKVSSLLNTVNALFLKTLDDAEQNALVAELQRRKCIEIKDQSVSYGTPITSGSPTLN